MTSRRVNIARSKYHWVALQERSTEITIGVSEKPDELYSILLKAIAASPQLRMVAGNKDVLKARFAWVWNDWSKEEYHFDFAISFDGDLCDVHFTPESPADSKKLTHAVASVIKAIASQGELRIIETHENTPLTKEPTAADVEKIGTFLEEQQIATLDQISEALGISELRVAISLHRLIDNGAIGCTPAGVVPNKFYFHKSRNVRNGRGF
jgi:hypothetical protein